MTITLSTEDLQQAIIRHLQELHIDVAPKGLFFNVDEGHGHTITVDVESVTVVL